MTARYQPGRAVADRRLALVVVALLVGFTAFRLRAPPVVAADAPKGEFSAARARDLLRALAGDGRPRVVGTPAAAAARDKIIERLRELGWNPRIQETFACGVIQSCARVQNIWALRPGQSGADGPLVMLSAHSDSVAAGPGASDDGVGASAVLEVARALSAEAALKHPVLLLLTDAEEAGLLGAEAFVAEHPLAKQVAVAVNLDARGTTGPSLMFETSEGNGPLIELYARHVERPLTSSIFYTVYKMLPNDTDLTVFRRAGMAGFNFAFIDGEARYHTAKDDVAHADLRTLQHQGDNALAMVRALGNADLSELGDGDAVFFDVFAFFTAHWPERWMPRFAAVALALMLVACALAVRRGHATIGALVWGILAALLALAATFALGVASHSVLQAAGAVPYAFLALPLPAKAAFWCGALAMAVWVSALFVWPAGRFGLFLSTFLIWGALGAFAAAVAPGLSFPFVLPPLCAGALGVLAALAPKGELLPRWLWIPSLLAAGVVLLPTAWLLYDGLGEIALSGEAVLFALALAPLSGVWGMVRECRSIILGALVAWAVGLVAQIAAPRFTADHPRKLNLAYVLSADAPAPTAQWVAAPWSGDLPEPLRAAGRFADQRTPPYPWPSVRQGFGAAAPALAMAAPTFAVQRAVVDGDALRVSGRLASPRGALDAALVLPSARLRSVQVNGKAVPRYPTKNLVSLGLATPPWTSIEVHTTGAEGVGVELELAGGEPVDAYVWDSTPGLPEQGRAFLQARPANAAPFQMGDRTEVVRSLRLAAGP